MRQSSCLRLGGGSVVPWNVSDGGSPGAKELREKSMGNVNGMRMELNGHGSLEEHDEMYAGEQLAVYSSRDARDGEIEKTTNCGKRGARGRSILLHTSC